MPDMPASPFGHNAELHPLTAGAYRRQLKARALLAIFCRDAVLEARMSPEVREILGIAARTAAAGGRSPRPAS